MMMNRSDYGVRVNVTNLPPAGYLGMKEVIDRTGGRTNYRKLDYWLRRGKITCAVDATGSGSARGFDEADVAALIAVLDRLDVARAIVSDFDSGALWRRYREA